MLIKFGLGKHAKKKKKDLKSKLYVKATWYQSLLIHPFPQTYMKFLDSKENWSLHSKIFFQTQTLLKEKLKGNGDKSNRIILKLLPTQVLL